MSDSAKKCWWWQHDWLTIEVSNEGAERSKFDYRKLVENRDPLLPPLPPFIGIRYTNDNKLRRRVCMKCMKVNDEIAAYHSDMAQWHEAEVKRLENVELFRQKLLDQSQTT